MSLMIGVTVPNGKFERNKVHPVDQVMEFAWPEKASVVVLRLLRFVAEIRSTLCLPASGAEKDNFCSKPFSTVVSVPREGMSHVLWCEDFFLVADRPSRFLPSCESSGLFFTGNGIQGQYILGP